MLRTPRLHLLRMIVADAPALFAFMSDEETMRHRPTIPHATYAVTEDFIRETDAAMAIGEADGHVITDGDGGWVRVDPRNAASPKLLRHLGFHKTGEAKATCRTGKDWVDSVDFSLSATDYGT